MTSYYERESVEEVSLCDMFLRSPYGVAGDEYLLPNLLPEFLKKFRRKEESCDQRKGRRRLSEEQMIRAWAEYRRELKELRERLQKEQQSADEFLLWLAMFWLQHYLELLRMTVIYKTKWAGQAKAELEQWRLRGFTDSINIFRQSQGEGWESLYGYYLGCEREWQDWAVSWLLDALRDDDLLHEITPAFPSASSQQAAGDKGGEASATP